MFPYVPKKDNILLLINYIPCTLINSLNKCRIIDVPTPRVLKLPQEKLHVLRGHIQGQEMQDSAKLSRSYHPGVGFTLKKVKFIFEFCHKKTYTCIWGFCETRGPLDLDVLEYAVVSRKSSLNQVTQNSWSTPLVNRVSDSKKENKTVLKRWLHVLSSMVENEWKTIRTHNNQT